MKRVSLFLAATAVAAAVATTAHAKALSFCAANNPEGFDPAPYISGATFDASSQALYNRLVEFERGTTRPVPALAESWEVSPDGLVYTFRLRQGVKFHTTDFFTPSRTLNADDVVFSLRRQMDRRHPYYDYAGGLWGYFDGMALGALIGAVDKVDDATVKITLTRPDPAIVADLAMDFASILSKEYADKLAAAKKREDIGRLPVGTGPFQFVGYQPDVRIDYRANPDYWRAVPAIDALSFLIHPDSAERLKMFKAGECQVLGAPDAATVAALKTDAGATLVQAEVLNVAYLAYNTTQKPFDDARVRLALNQAIDRAAIVASVYGGNGVVAKGPLPSSMWSATQVVAAAAADPEGAKKALEAAGVSGLKLKIRLPSVARSYNPDPARVAAMIKADLAKAGVEVEVVATDLGEFVRSSSAKDRDGAVLFGWTSDNGDPDNFLGALLACDTVGISNRAQWCDPAFNDAVLKARATTDPVERARLYGEAQKAFAAEAPWATIAHTVVSVGVAKAVGNYAADPFGRHNFEGVDLAE